MPAQSSAPPRRVTPERITALAQRYAALEGLSGWRFSVAIVPGLKTPDGKDAWATIVPDPETKTAAIKVRDIDATPIPGFDGDPMLEIRVTFAHELFHCVVADALAATGGEFTIPAEETIVEAAARAIVRSEGTTDARVMARAVRALPSALRARISASAGQRARGAGMDPIDLILAAVEAAAQADDPKEALAALLGKVRAIKDGTASPAEPDGDEAPAAKVEAAPAPGGTDGGGYPPPAEDARRGKGTDMNDEMARARRETLALRDEMKAMVEAGRPAAKEGLCVGLRARLGSAFTPAAEAEIMAAPDFTTAQKFAAFAEKLLGGKGGGPERARSGVEHEANPGQGSGPKLMSREALEAEGHSASWISGYVVTAKLGPQAAQAYLEQGRASLRARKGVAS
ncbi:MAG TPA: hypothetical protein VLT47_03275 [Anaeromyxobacteraceae bacterium]|nr:hypothetical protein [Anaeromyxobacteraceae bacterium]